MVDADENRMSRFKVQTEGLGTEQNPFRIQRARGVGASGLSGGTRRASRRLYFAHDRHGPGGACLYRRGRTGRGLENCLPWRPIGSRATRRRLC